MCCLPDSHLHSSASIWGEHSVPPISADWEIILYYILEDVVCARHLAKCFLRALSLSLNYCYPHFTKEEIKASPLLSRLAPQPTAVPPPRGRFGNLHVL